MLLNIFMKMSDCTVVVMGYRYNSILKVRNGAQKHLVWLVWNMEMDKSLIINGVLLENFGSILADLATED